MRTSDGENIDPVGEFDWNGDLHCYLDHLWSILTEVYTPCEAAAGMSEPISELSDGKHL